ncbi:MAG: hypothetical protein RJB65_682 [Actinomycetota bacterium]
MGGVVLAIDQGTSATKAVVASSEGEVLGLAESPVTVSASADGAVEFDPESMWQSVLDAARTALAAAGNPALDAIGLGNQGETIVPWNRRTGSAVGAAVVWQDGRSSGVCDALRPHEERLATLTGLALDPYFVAPKLRWWHDLHGHPADVVVTTSDTWLLRRLCGAFATDVATAGRTLLLDLDTLTWSDEACAMFGLDPAALPTVVRNAGVVGECSLFGGSVPVSGLCVDQQAALFAERCREPGEAKCTYGTGAFLLASTGLAPRRSTNGLVACPAWDVGDGAHYCLDGQVFTAGAAISWLVDLGILSSPADLDALGGSVSDSDGVVFVPALAGLAAPWWQPAARASLTGMSLSTRKEHLARAAIDGIAAQVALLARAVGRDLGAPLARLRVDGGITRSATLLQVQADLLQCPVEVYPSPHATALGVAEMAAVGLGLGWDAPPVVERIVEPSITADEAAHRLARWEQAADDVAGRR